MLRPATLLLALLAGLAAPARADDGASLRGSPKSMVRQNEIAKEHDYTFLRTPGQVSDFVEKGYLVPVEGDESYSVSAGVSFPYARPELLTFLERLGAQHREGCGEKLVVTSLVRPTALQPPNAHKLSVHPAGMAVDFRVSRSGECRAWLENTLLSLERRGVLDVTRERNPPHYHVAVFTGEYAAHVERLREDSLAAVKAEEARLAARMEEEAPAPVQAAAAFAPAPEPAERRASSATLPLAVLVVGIGTLAVQFRRRLHASAEGARDLG